MAERKTCPELSRVCEEVSARTPWVIDHLKQCEDCRVAVGVGIAVICVWETFKHFVLSPPRKNAADKTESGPTGGASNVVDFLHFKKESR